MNRRTLLHALGTLLPTGILARAASTPSTSQTPLNDNTNPLDPYDAIKAVYDGFESVGDQSEIDFDRMFSSAHKYRICCKLIYSNSSDYYITNSSKQYYNKWLIFSDSIISISKTEHRERELSVLSMVKGSDLKEENCAGSSIFLAAEGAYDIATNSFSRKMFKIYSTRFSSQQDFDCPELVAITRFLSLVSKK